MYKKKDNILYFFGAACRWMSLALPDRFSVVRQERFWESIAFMFRNDTFCQIFSVKSISYVKKNLSFFCDITCASILVIGKCQKVTFFTSSDFRVRQFPHSLQCGNFSIFCQSFYVKSIICRDDRSTKTTVLFSNSLFSKTVTFMKFLPKMREREFPYFPHCVTATKFFFPSNQSILKFFSKTSIWRNFCDGARKNFVKSLYIQRSKKRNHFETRSSWKNFVKSLYLREDKKLQ